MENIKNNDTGSTCSIIPPKPDAKINEFIHDIKVHAILFS